VTWNYGEEDYESANVPLKAGDHPIIEDIEAEVYNLSDLIFYLCNVRPIKVLKRSGDPESQMIRLSFRDIWRYCYLDQTHLDSSFYQLEDPFKGRKSQDAMRFFTGLHSEELSQLQVELYRAVEEQQGARQAVIQIRQFMARFDFGSEIELSGKIEKVKHELEVVESQKRELGAERLSDIHPTDDLRGRLRALSRIIADLHEAIDATQNALAEQSSLRAELITTKVKADRISRASSLFEGVEYSRCPHCGSNLETHQHDHQHCHLCGTPLTEEISASIDEEIVRRELNDRIDQLADSINRRKQALQRSLRELKKMETEKRELDQQLQDELQRYDSVFIERIRLVESRVAMLKERQHSLIQLQEMPRAISELEEKAGASQGVIDRLRSTIKEELNRLRGGDENAQAIALEMKKVMLEVGFPGVSDEDTVVLAPKNWKPIIVHAEQSWGFWDTGSGGKKTLFNICYALAVHRVARDRGLPVPNIMIIDSPTKNISEDENPELVQSLYRNIYKLASTGDSISTQFLLIDSDLVEPEFELSEFTQYRMAGEPDAPSLISYYSGP
jgi:hypothetical protein